jgi:hypothetical protein
MGGKISACSVFVEEPEGKRPLGRPRPRGRIILKWILEQQDGGVDWIHLAEDRDQW